MSAKWFGKFDECTLTNVCLRRMSVLEFSHLNLRGTYYYRPYDGNKRILTLFSHAQGVRVFDSLKSNPVFVHWFSIVASDFNFVRVGLGSWFVWFVSHRHLIVGLLLWLWRFWLLLFHRFLFILLWWRGWWRFLWFGLRWLLHRLGNLHWLSLGWFSLGLDFIWFRLAGFSLSNRLLWGGRFLRTGLWLLLWLFWLWLDNLLVGLLLWLMFPLLVLPLLLKAVNLLLDFNRPSWRE